ncbi:hypothetical protein [Nostoc sp. TCL26-01]|uniref:hypothetical protein n=1 Tax=Nostoc sp. TCL26-01 TaxID=2576904 RepID=UPI0015B94A7C|nr:hypothetical protein [Nostoc sp. TCL26-01]QLE58897.1 hypothetical protein FD725_27395 [Nostoc sp. TCL26-01]
MIRDCYICAIAFRKDIKICAITLSNKPAFVWAIAFRKDIKICAIALSNKQGFVWAIALNHQPLIMRSLS